MTLGRRDVTELMLFVREPQGLPEVLSVDEVAELLRAAPGLKYRAALSVAYGAGLRALGGDRAQGSDIDNGRMLIRVEKGKGRKDRFVMLSPHLLEILRAWWKEARPRGWLLPGRDPGQPMTTRQLNRACHDDSGTSPPTCSNRRPTCASSRFCSGTRSWRHADDGSGRCSYARNRRTTRVDDPKWERVEAAAKGLGLSYSLGKITDRNQAGVMMTPALMVDGKIKSSGKVLTPEQIKALLS